MKRVVIVGVGFGGLRAARALSGKGLDVLLVDRNNYHLFQPLLYQVATAILEQESIVYPVREIIRHWEGIRFQLAEVRNIDLERRQILTSETAIDYDYLILAAGSITNYFGMDTVKRYGYDLKYLSDAVMLRSHILYVFERAAQKQNLPEREALLTFVIVGGGPTGVEFAGALSELVHHVLSKDYPELQVKDVRIILVEAGSSLLPSFPKKLQEYTALRLRQIGVEVRPGTAVSGAEPSRVLLRDGTWISSYTLFWAAGVCAASLADALPVMKVKGSRIVVNQNLTIGNHPEVFVIGDMAYFEQDGQPLPLTAPVAMQQGEYAGRAILRGENGKPIKPFRYQDRGSMATIGRGAAVANIQNLNFSGFPAWLIWLVLHLFFLIGFRNRLVVLLNWAYDYFFFKKQVRIITQGAKEEEPERR
ncbi:MAG: NAD(P)/FAD-dependent oxidoreductase [Candidatus Loosdrechtia sp.]|uniref:NAD(P)/FAD-dependent oxidoreductase n=1 Tax=Candidatus Loosdrechtia sp. TaxID=3101272 RepID=UPI003A614B0C|nr:MAG: NAD(P)/FAD-dependent oxidoreductase [Candidatus Jettenia sp. AMX2]